MLLLAVMAVDKQAGTIGTGLEPLRLPESDGPAAASLRCTCAS
jgi:hypothetical protein